MGAQLGNLTGMAALVTGATSVIGPAISEQFAASGAELLLTGRNGAAGLEIAKHLGACSFAGDIADPAFPDLGELEHRPEAASKACRCSLRGGKVAADRSKSRWLRASCAVQGGVFQWV
jgi:NAD(P)-dependent dehydrogenase (short-subunit alcohol dehydrogenase family)